MSNAGNKKRSRKTKKVLTPDQIKKIEQKKEQTAHIKSVRTILNNIGFTRAANVEGHEFVFDTIRTELDDAFVYDNLILILEYTTGKPHEHLKSKSIFYQRVSENPSGFITFLRQGHIPGLKQAIDDIINNDYQENEIICKIAYASKQDIKEEDKTSYERTGISFFDYPIVQYFSIISKTIKKSARFEFFDFLGIDPHKIGPDRYQAEQKNSFTAQILPESRSSMERGYYVISMYISPADLLRRVYVLRNDSWREQESANLYQRLLDVKKVKSMRKYLSAKRYVYVNNIIVTLDSDNITLYNKNDDRLSLTQNGVVGIDGNTSELAKIEIKDRPNIIGIIDGQHRVFSYHEGDDNEEATISSLRTKHNLLVTGILFPKTTSISERRRFEANLFLEINSKQQSPQSGLKQRIAEILEPLSPTSISQKIIKKLNSSGPLENHFESHFYEQDKIKTATIISYGLKPLIKLSGDDSLFSIWEDPEKELLLSEHVEDETLARYIDYCVESIRNAFIAFKQKTITGQWAVSKKGQPGILSVVYVNGMLNLIRLCIEKNKTCDLPTFQKAFARINDLTYIKEFHSSQYRKLGEKMYHDYFEC